MQFDPPDYIVLGARTYDGARTIRILHDRLSTVRTGNTSGHRYSRPRGGDTTGKMNPLQMLGKPTKIKGDTLKSRRTRR